MSKSGWNPFGFGEGGRVTTKPIKKKPKKNPKKDFYSTPGLVRDLKKRGDALKDAAGDSAKRKTTKKRKTKKA